MSLALIKKGLDDKVLEKITDISLKKALLNTQDKNIKNYSNKEMQDLIKYLLKMCKFIGITDPPELDVLQMIGQFIKDYWGHLNIKEINDAIYLSIKNNEINHFNKLTPQILNKAFTQYHSNRQKALFEYRKHYSELYE